MFKRFRTLFITLILFLSFAVPANAVLPVLAWPLIVSIGAHIVAGVVILTTSLRSGGATNVNRSRGTIARGAKVDWVDLTMVPPTAKSKDIVAKIPITDIQNKLLTDPAAPSKYPKLTSALVNGTGPYPPLTPSSKAGQRLSNTIRLSTNVGCTGPYDPSGPEITDFNNMPSNPLMTRFVTTESVGGGYPAGYALTCSAGIESAPPEAVTPKTVAEAEDTLDPPRDNSVETEFRGEIDDFITSNPNIVHFADTPDVAQADSAPEYVPNIPSDAQVQAAVAADAAASAAKAAQDAAAARTASDRARYDAALARAAAANAAAANAPGDSGLANAAATANAEANAAGSALSNSQAAESAAAADAAKAQADAAKAAAEADAAAAAAASASIPTATGYDVEIIAPDKKSISDLLSSWVSSSPLSAMVRSFTISTSGAVSSVSCGTIYGRELKFDFIRYADTFSACGGVLLVIVHGFAVFIVIKGW